ncbi:MAG TPA: amidase [Chloroflexota bacterium]|nr:amidase [Chloroflexota bacterium]
MTTSKLWQLSATALLAGYARRAFSPVEVLDELLGRIAQLDHRLHAYLAVNAADARRAARAAEAAWLAPGERPLLCGVPVSVKDLIEMAGLPTTYGSLAFRENHQADAEVVARLRRAGAVLVGKTNTPEFGLLGGVRNRLGPDGRNPWSLERSCGGSSGGAAAAVAAGLGPLAVGSDSGGSIRGPAAFNGVFGLKPSQGRVPEVQRWCPAPGRGQGGPLARTVRDSALLLQALAGPDPRDPDALPGPVPNFLGSLHSPLRDVRVAVSADLGNVAGVDAEVGTMIDEAAALLRERGCVVSTAAPPALATDDVLAPGVWAYAGDLYAALEMLEPDFLARHSDALTDYAAAVCAAGQRALAWQYRGILRRNAAYAEAMRGWFEGYDFLVCPAAAGPAPRVEAVRPINRGGGRTPGFLPQFNVAQTPAASIPFAFHSSGLPLAIQVVGRHGDDAGVLQLAAAIEAARPWADRWPPGAFGMDAEEHDRTGGPGATC